MVTVNKKRIKENYAKNGNMKLQASMFGMDEKADKFTQALLKMKGRKRIYFITAHNMPINLKAVFEGVEVDKSKDLNFDVIAKFEIDVDGKISGTPVEGDRNFWAHIQLVAACDGAILIENFPDGNGKGILYSVALIDFEFQCIPKELIDEGCKFYNELVGANSNHDVNGNFSDYLNM